MNATKYRWILYTIIFVILGTISIQVYWNYKNYIINKQQFINDVQISLDNAVDTYYSELAKKNTIGFTYSSESEENSLARKNILRNILEKIDTVNESFGNLDSISVSNVNGVKVFRGSKTDSLISNERNKKNFTYRSVVGLNPNLEVRDSVFIEEIKELSTSIVLSFSKDSLNLKRIDSLFNNELKDKSLAFNYGLSFKENYKKPQYFKYSNIEEAELSRVSKSNLLPKNGILKAHFSNETKIILQRSLSGILISTLLILAVISCLFYLLKIIKHQKQLAEVRNDFISNITHEFKTPIATIGVALESIKDFNIIDDKEKTRTYLDLSNTQLSKLNIMVEKLLETATLDSENLNLNKEETNIGDTLNLIISKHQLQPENKHISFSHPQDIIIGNIDTFHFENVINNIIDNAIKYGGANINVDLKQSAIAFTILISDDGNVLTKTDASKIFEKFYRIPKGNTHDVKGFGIGLYYAKKIIEKHGGTISLDIDNSLTTFKLSFPNG